MTEPCCRGKYSGFSPFQLYNRRFLCPNKRSQVSCDLLLSLEQAVSCVNWDTTEICSRRINNLHSHFWMFCPKEELNWALEKEWCGFFYSAVGIKVKIHNDESPVHKLWVCCAYIHCSWIAISQKLTFKSYAFFFCNVFFLTAFCSLTNEAEFQQISFLYVSSWTHWTTLGLCFSLR